jgi:hypothetical protein
MELGIALDISEILTLGSRLVGAAWPSGCIDEQA